MNPQDLQKAIDWAKKNPNDPRATELRRRIEGGLLNKELKDAGMQTFKIKPPKPKYKAELNIDPLSQRSNRPEEQVSGIKETGMDVVETAKGVGEQLTQGAKEIQDVWKNDGLNVLQKFVGTAGKAAGASAGAIGEGFVGAGKTLLTQNAEDAFKEKIQEIGEKASETKVVKGIADWYEGLNEDEKLIVDSAGGIISLAMEFVGLKGAQAGVNRAKPIVEEGVKQTRDFVSETAPVVARQVDEVFRPTEAKLEAKIDNLFTKAVRPTLRGKETIGQMEKGRQQAIDAVKTINLNAPNLKYTDELGDVVEGRSPESLREFSQAIDQTKKSIYEQYNTLAKQTGDAGVTINPAAFVDEFDKFINDKAVQTASPETIKYAKTMRDRYGSVGELGPEDIENIIKIYNQDLQTFYRNPTADQGRKVAVDAMVVNNLRKQLDETIAKTTGEEYQALKTKYGALRSIEKDVLNATLRDARKNTAGLIDFTDIFSGGQLAAGVISMNPAMIGSAATQRGIKSYFKYLNDPNTNVKKMFNTAETLQSRPEAGFFERSVSKDVFFNSGEIPETTIKKGAYKNKEIGKIDLIQGDDQFGLTKIKKAHPDVLPYLDQALQKATVVESLPDRKILEAKINGQTMRIVVDEQLGTKKGIKKQTFLNNAYFKK